MLDSITFLHSKNIIHRDLNSANTMATKKGMIKLGDFGVSCESKKKRNTFIGTPLYMAPEVIECDPAREQTKKGNWYTDACDIWSLGITFIEFAGVCCYWRESCVPWWRGKGGGGVHVGYAFGMFQSERSRTQSAYVPVPVRHCARARPCSRAISLGTASYYGADWLYCCICAIAAFFHSQIPSAHSHSCIQ